MPFPFWENFSDNFMEYALSSYDAIDPWLYPLLFVAIIGYVYAAMQSVIVTVGAIIITFAIYATTTNVFAEQYHVSMLMYIITIVGIASLIVALMLKLSKTE